MVEEEAAHAELRDPEREVGAAPPEAVRPVRGEKRVAKGERNELPRLDNDLTKT